MDEDGTIDVETLFGGGTPLSVHTGRTLVLAHVPDGVADASDLAEWLQDQDNLTGLQSLLDGHSTSMDNNGRWQGVLTDSAADWLQELADRCQAVCYELPQYWDANDYYIDTSRELIEAAFSDDRQTQVELLVDAALTDSEPAHLEPADVDSHLDWVKDNYCHQCYEDSRYCTCEEDSAC